MMKNEQPTISVEYIITLLQLPRIGRKTARNLIEKINLRITSEKELFELIDDCRHNLRIPTYSDFEKDNAIKNADKICNEANLHGVKIITYNESCFPENLNKMDDFPLVLNYKGNMDSINKKPNIAIIGTRKPTDFGIELGVRLGQIFSENGFNIVSGLAIGCDTAGHKGALSRNNSTTAVLAHGLDSIYPKENKYLAEEILQKGGVLLSEYFIKQRPIGNFFIERDRIQAGLSDAVIVVETDVKGGTMHTVKFCLNYGRILAAINYPEKFHNENPSVKGNKLLIDEKGAVSIYSKDDIDDLVEKVKIVYTDKVNGNNKNSDDAFLNFTKKMEKPKQLKLWE